MLDSSMVDRLAKRLYSQRKGPRPPGWTHERREAYRIKQDGKCAICRGYPGNRALCQDHDHETGLPRALLCNGCNTGLGHFGEDIGRMLAAVAYLRAHGKQSAAEVRKAAEESAWALAFAAEHERALDD